MSRRCRQVHTAPGSAFAGFRFRPEIIVLAVRWKLWYGRAALERTVHAGDGSLLSE